MKPILYVVTALYRHPDLNPLIQSLGLLGPHFAVRWLPIADTSDGTDGCVKRNMALRMIERLPAGWVYHLDDDNLIHPLLGAAAAAAIRRTNNQEVFLLPQVARDGSWYIEHPRVAYTCVDTGGFLVSTAAAQGIYWRMEPHPDAPDYDWIARVCAKGYVPRVIDGLAYYNAGRCGPSDIQFSCPPDEMRDEAYRRYQAGDRTGAERLCRQLLQQNPHNANAVYLLGVIALDAGQLAGAVQLFRQAALLAPDNAVFANALGEVYLRLGRQEDAAECLRQALLLRPTYDRVHNNLGRLHHARGDLPAAQASFAEAVWLNPHYATAHNNLGAVLQAQGELSAAVTHFRQAVALQPDYPEAYFNLGTATQALGDPVAAAACFREALRLRPTYARAHYQLGLVLDYQRGDVEATACFQAAVRLQPDDAEAYRSLGNLLLRQQQWEAAQAAMEQAATLRPADPDKFASRVHLRQMVCDWRTYAADLDRLWADAETQLAAGEATAVVPFQALPLPWPRPRLLAVARSHSAAVAKQQRERWPDLNLQPARARSGRLRVGYLSGDFYDHPISHLLQGLFGHHDRDQFEVFAYSIGPADDSVYRQRIAAGCEHFVEVAALSLPALARRIAADGIHVLVDLMGHTGVNRLGVLALRPAPIQVSFLGMLGTTGADFLDYLITDRIVTPPEFAADFTEHFVTLPHCYLIAEPEPALPVCDVRRDAYGLPETGFVYCSFNGSYKIEPRTFATWMRILAHVPDSMLWLYSTGALFENNLRREAAAHGVAAERLVFAPFVPRPEHLLRHRAADLFLDSLLYNAAATATLALQAGLPVLTCPGDTFAARVGASLLQAVGLPELVAPDVAHYERQAIELARKPEVLHALRDRLVAGRTSAPLFDTPRFVRNLERAYQAMWERFAAGGSPQPLEVIEPGEEPR